MGTGEVPRERVQRKRLQTLAGSEKGLKRTAVYGPLSGQKRVK